MEVNVSDLAPVIIAFVVAAIIGYIIVRVLKKKKIEELRTLKESGGIDDESAYSAIATTERILHYSNTQGIDVTTAQEYLRLARSSYGTRSYVAAVSYCTQAKKSLMDSKNKMLEEQLPTTEETEETVAEETIPVPNIAPPVTIEDREVPEMARVSKDTEDDVEIENLEDLTEKAESILLQKDNKLPSKFTIHRAKEALALAEKEGRPLEEAIQELDMAEEAFDEERYDYALAHANRSKKIADGEDTSELPPITNIERPTEQEEQDEDGFDCPNCGELLYPEDEKCPSCGVEILQKFMCPSCNNEVKDDSTFCRHCGSKLTSEIVSCKSCGAEVPGDSAFCPKCGTKI